MAQAPAKDDAQPERTSMFDDVQTPGIASASVTPGDGLMSDRDSYFDGASFARSPSFSASSAIQDAEELDTLPPLDRLTVFDFLENLALPQRLERLQVSLAARTEKVRRQQERIAANARKRVVDEWRKRIPPPDEQLSKYRRSMRHSVDRINRRWNDTRTISLKEKVSFIAGVLNIFISGYVIGAFPQYFHLWYTAQLCYFYPIRFYTYHMRGFHYFLVDLCYFVNLLLVLSIWVFPNSKRLFISTFCLAFGNNAVAIAMWRNSLVFHSLDKVTSLFIHIMPCATIHCIVHLLSDEVQRTRFPAVYTIRHSQYGAPEHYSLAHMVIWATIPYAFWQLSYHFLITVRRREKILAGRPTSFTWLRRSYSKTWIGRFVLSLPEAAQEPAFMLIQYIYALLTMLPAPIWFWYRIPSALFLLVVFTISVHNGASYYIDVFGKRFQKELDQLKKDVAKWQMSPELGGKSPMTPASLDGEIHNDQNLKELSLGAPAAADASEAGKDGTGNRNRKFAAEVEYADKTLAEEAGGAGTGTASASASGAQRPSPGSASLRSRA